VYKVDRENRYSKFDHPDAKRLRMSALRAIFVDTGTIKYLKARYNDSSEEKKLRKKYPNNACVGLRNEIPFVEENPGKESYLILHPNFVFRGSDRGFYNSYGHFQVTESHYHTELVLPSVSYLVLYDRDVSNDVNSLVMRKVAKRDDGHVEVTTLCLEPKPVFVHYSSATDELRYAVPIHIKLDAYDVVPGTDSPDAMQGPLNEQEVAAFMF